MKVGDLVKWASKTSPDYYGKHKEAIGIILNVHRDVAEVWLDGIVVRWHNTKLKVISESG